MHENQHGRARLPRRGRTSWVARRRANALTKAIAALFELAGALAARRDRSDDSELAALIRALGAIGAPPAELTVFALGHLSSREVFGAGASALLAVKARLSPDELAALRLGGEEHSTIPRHPRAFDGSWDVCFAANEALLELEGIAQGEPPPPVPALNLGRNLVSGDRSGRPTH